MGAVERGEEEVLTGNVSTCSEGIGNGLVRHLRGVVLLREVAEEDIAQFRMEIIRNELCTSLVALVSARGKDALLEVDGIGAVEEHVLIVVGFDDEVVGVADSLLNVGIRFAAVGDKDETLSVSTNLIAETIGGVVADTERRDLEIAKSECLTFLEIAAGSAQFLAQPVVAVDAFVDEAGCINRDMRPFAERADGADMVSVVVGDKDPEEVTKIESEGTQVPMDGPRRDTGINKYALLT